MYTLSIEALADIEVAILDELPDKLNEILVIANRSGRLDELLNILGLAHILEPSDKIQPYKDGKILVIGDNQVGNGIAKNLGISKERLEFCLGYEVAKRFSFSKLEYAPEYCAVLVGPMPHKTVSTEGFSSAITALEEKHRKNVIPAVIKRLSSNSGALKITKSGFREGLCALISEGAIAS